MTAPAKRYVVELMVAERVLKDHLDSLGGQSSSNRRQNGHTIEQFLAALAEPRLPEVGQFMLSETAILQWLIHDGHDRTAQDASLRLSTLRRYLRTLMADLEGRDVDWVANLKSRHGNPTWRRLILVLQSRDALALLAAIETSLPAIAPYQVDRAVAVAVLNRILTSMQGQSSTHRNLTRRTIQKFLADLCAPQEIPKRFLVLDESRLLHWMIEDAVGRSVDSAWLRLSLVSRYLSALVQAGFMDTNLMVIFQARYGNRSWARLVPALQSGHPETSLAALEVTPRPPGPLDPYVRDYLELQRSLGKRYEENSSVLKDLDRFLQATGVSSMSAVTATVIDGWTAGMTCSSGTRRVKVHIVRRFFEYLHRLRGVVQNPLAASLVSEDRLPARAFHPFIFSQEQVAAILKQAQQLPKTCYCQWKAETCYTMLALLYTLGLRHGEVRRLRIRDLAFDRGTLFIAETKFYKSRYVPFGPKTAACLQRFLEVRRTVLPPLQPDDPLFVTLWRAPIGTHFLRSAFHSILDRLNIRGPMKQQGPRLHDLRHSFAVHRLLRWYRERSDVQSCLPLLSVFMGHVEVRSTEVYLTITKELLKEANDRFYRHFGGQLEQEVRP